MLYKLQDSTVSILGGCFKVSYYCFSRLLFPDRDKEEQKTLADQLLAESGVSHTLRAQDLTVEQFGAVSHNYWKNFVNVSTPPPPSSQTNNGVLLSTHEKGVVSEISHTKHSMELSDSYTDQDRVLKNDTKTLQRWIWQFESQWIKYTGHDWLDVGEFGILVFQA